MPGPSESFTKAGPFITKEEMESLLSDVARVRELSSFELPKILATLAGKYPELCCQPLGFPFGDPLAGSASDGDEFSERLPGLNAQLLIKKPRE